MLQDVPAGVVGGLHVLQIEEDVDVTAPVQGFQIASGKVGALHRQVAADSDRSTARVHDLGHGGGVESRCGGRGDVVLRLLDA